MNPLYFRITEKPDPDVFDAGWVEILDNRPYVLDRTVWRRSEVSRTASGCVVLRADHEFGTWELRNRAARVVVLGDSARRYELLTGMSMTLDGRTWQGRLTDAFGFAVTSEPPAGRVRRHDDGDDDRADVEPSGDLTTHPELSLRVRSYLATHWQKRFALAYMWREHLTHTRDQAQDVPSATVGRAFGVTDRKIMRWREDLAFHVHDERGHQHAIRDEVLKAGLMSTDDVAQADRYVADLRRSRS